MPFPEVNVDKGIGYALEEHVCAELCHTADAHAAGHFVLAGCEVADAFCEGLAGEVVYLTLGEGAVGSQSDGGQSRDTLVEDKIVGADEAVLGREDWLYVTIELQAEQHNEHAQEVGEEEASQLRQTDVPAKEFPDESHRRSVLS